MRKTLVILCGIVLASCSNVKSEVKNEDVKTTDFAIKASTVPTSVMNNTEHNHDVQTETGYKPSFISAAYLLEKINKKDGIVIFDVRNKESYDESHIKTALNKPIPITADSVRGIPQKARVVTYCGCPHHLSSIAAEQLTKLGYKDVHVLNEGFWYWKDHKYPMQVASASTSTLSEIKVEGVLAKQDKPVSNVDIYLKHESSGQLEATRTDAKGGYKMNFHLYNYKNNDKFKFYVGDLKTPVQDFSTDKKETFNVAVNMK